MKVIKTLGLSVMVVAMSASASFAKVVDESKGVVQPIAAERTLADNVVVTPQGTSSPSAVQPVQPVQQVQPVQPVQTVPVAPQRTVVTETKPSNYMATIAVSALLGGVAGALIGGAVYLLDDQQDARNIAYWTGGGILVGTGVGVINVLADENRAERAVGTRFDKDPVPTYRLSLVKMSF
jgi:hypothetical protein